MATVALSNERLSNVILCTLFKPLEMVLLVAGVQILRTTFLSVLIIKPQQFLSIEKTILFRWILRWFRMFRTSKSLFQGQQWCLIISKGDLLLNYDKLLKRIVYWERHVHCNCTNILGYMLYLIQLLFVLLGSFRQ